MNRQQSFGQATDPERARPACSPLCVPAERQLRFERVLYDGQSCHGPEAWVPTSVSSHTAIQPQTTTEAIVTRTTISTSARSGDVAREARRHVHVRGHSVETELVALDVLHHEARLVVSIGRQ